MQTINSKGLETVWWSLIVLVLAIVVLMIFYFLIKTGMFQIGSLSSHVFGAPEQFANAK